MTMEAAETAVTNTVEICFSPEDPFMIVFSIAMYIFFYLAGAYFGARDKNREH